MNAFNEPVPLEAKPGQMYKVNAEILDDNEDDHAKKRFAVVLVAASGVGGRITVVTRTSDTDHRPGVPSTKNTPLGLDRHGVWGYLRTAPATLWTDEHVELLDTIGKAELDKIMAVFL